MSKFEEKIDKAYEQIEKEVDNILDHKTKRKPSKPQPAKLKGKPRVYFQEKEEEKKLSKAETEKEIESIKKELFKDLFKKKK